MRDWPDDQLEDAIMTAHETSDGLTLTDLYAEAARRKRSVGHDEAYWFLLTQSYVYALDSGHERAEKLRLRLQEAGREA